MQGIPLLRARSLQVVAILFIVSLSSTHAAHGAVYQYFPATTLSLGHGFDPRSPSTGFLPCIEDDAPVSTDGDGSRQVALTLSFIRSYRDLYQYLHVDSHLSAHYLFASGDASFSLEHEFSLQQEDVVLAIRASVDWGRRQLHKPHLSSEASALLQQPSQFYQRCGSEFVLQDSLAAQAVALYVLHSLSSTDKMRINAAFSAGAELNFAGGNVSASVTSVVQEILQRTAIEVQVVGFGGGGFIPLKPIVSDYKDLNKVADALKEYVGGLDRTHAVPVQYVTAPFERFGAPAAIPASGRRDLFLSELSSWFIQLENRWREHGRLLRSDTPIDPPNLAPRIEQQYLDLFDALDSIIVAGRACQFDEGMCDLHFLGNQTQRFKNLLRLAVLPNEIFGDRLADSEFSYSFPAFTTPNRHNEYPVINSGSYSLQSANNGADGKPTHFRITRVEYHCSSGSTEDICGYSYPVPRRDQTDYSASYQVSGDATSFTWTRQYTGHSATEYYVAFYEPYIASCVKNCRADS